MAVSKMSRQKISPYDTLKESLKQSVSDIATTIPEMCKELKNEIEAEKGKGKLDKSDFESINDRVKKDCLEAGVPIDMIYRYMPQEYKDEEQVESGRKAGQKSGEKRKEKQKMSVLIGGQTVANLTNDGKDSNEKSTKLSPKPKPSKDLGATASDLMGFAANEMKKSKPSQGEEKAKDDMIKISDIPSEMLDTLLSKEKMKCDPNESNDERFKKEEHDCTKHTIYLRAQAIIENQKTEISELQAKVKEFDADNFKPANAVKSVFQVQRHKDARAENEEFYENLEPLAAITKVKKSMEKLMRIVEKEPKRAFKIEIAWRIVE